jgi:hypothetical protein
MFSDLFDVVTPRVLQLYPLKENLDPRFHVPSVRKEVELNCHLNN